MTIMDACRYLNVGYQKFYRAMGDGMVDVVRVNNRRMVREQSVMEMSRGLRRPTPEAVARREAKNAARREAYRTERSGGAA